MVDGRNPPHLGCRKPCKQWDKLLTSTGAGFLSSTVVGSIWIKIELTIMQFLADY